MHAHNITAFTNLLFVVNRDDNGLVKKKHLQPILHKSVLKTV